MGGSLRPPLVPEVEDPVLEDPIPEDSIPEPPNQFVLDWVNRYFEYKKEEHTCFSDYARQDNIFYKQLSKVMKGKVRGEGKIQKKKKIGNHAIFMISEICERKGAMVWT